MTLSAFYCLAVLAPILALGAEIAKANVYEDIFTYGERMTHEEGCNLAEESLKRKAVAEVCGSLLSGGSMRALGETTDVLYRMHFETTGGRVTAYQRVSRQPGDGFTCTVRATLTVQCDQGRRDPTFLPVAEGLVKLNETVFREGEKLQIAVRMPPNLQGAAHLNVVLLMPNEEPAQRVARIYPNRFDTGKPLAADAALRIPESKNYDMELSLPKGRKSTEESLMFIFSRKPFSLPEAMSIEQLHGALSEMPLGERRELVLTYRIESRAARQIPHK